MANSSREQPTYLCHFCSKECFDRSTLVNHISQCQIKKYSPRLSDKTLKLPQLNQVQFDILQMVKLRPSINKQIKNIFRNDKINNNNNNNNNNVNLQIPISNLCCDGHFPCSNQSSFDDSYCSLENSETDVIKIDDTNEEENSKTNQLNNKVLSYHIYKYSHREYYLFYKRMERLLCKKPLSLGNKSYHYNQRLSPIFSNQKHFSIDIPTKIYSRQRINMNPIDICPLLFYHDFNTLVRLSINELLKTYMCQMETFFHLINSIATQEFQFIVNSYDYQHQFSYTPLSLLNVLRRTLYDHTTNSHTSYKRNYSQIFPLDNSINNDEYDSNMNHDNELSIPPLKIRRYDDSSYEIEKRSTSSSSSGMSITQINNGQQYDDRRRQETRSKKSFSRNSDKQTNSNYFDTDKKDIPDLILESPVNNNLSIIDQQQSKDQTNTETSFNSLSCHMSETKLKKTISPNSIKETANETQPKYQSVALNEGARIRIVNCSNDNNKNSTVRSQTTSAMTKKLTNSTEKIDENCATKTTRHNTRKISSTNSKTPEILELVPTYQAKPVNLSDSEISKQWSTHSVFYRCHACAHEEFFVVLSRECMRLHVSSKHGNMEENFKQRLSNFLNNQGRALKIFQHYLKWQQPWSEDEIDQIFQLSNVDNRTNGVLQNGL